MGRNINGIEIGNFMKISLKLKNTNYPVEFSLSKEQEFTARVSENLFEGELIRISDNEIWLKTAGRTRRIRFARDGEQIFIAFNGHVYEFELPEKEEALRPGHGGHSTEPENKICAPMPGKILKLFVKEGQEVAGDDPLFIVEAMKMENEIKSPKAGLIKKINFAVNDLVSVGQPIIEMEFSADAETSSA